jgi:hypothetical protein
MEITHLVRRKKYMFPPKWKLANPCKQVKKLAKRYVNCDTIKTSFHPLSTKEISKLPPYVRGKNWKLKTNHGLNLAI